MGLRNTLILALSNALSKVGLRLVRLAPNKVRGIEPVLDLKYLIKNNPSPTILDVGANNGETVSEFLVHFPAARIIAFEPFEQCYDILRGRFRSSPNVTIEKLALGAAAGRGTLNVYSANRMNSLLPLDNNPENELRAKFADVTTRSVGIETLDDYCRINAIAHIDILKVDTQGYDLNVLRGASELLQHHKVNAILIEANFIPMYKEQASFSELHDFVTGRGYRLVDLYNHVRPHDYTAWSDVCYVRTGEDAPDRTSR